MIVAGGAALVGTLPGCRLPEATRIPPSGPEPARALTERGARNLVALAELSAALRWLHPSDEAAACEWEPLLLDGVRGLESAATPTELAEGLRGLFEGVAPTMLLWRAELETAKEGEGKSELDADACPDPEADAKESESELEKTAPNDSKPAESKPADSKPADSKPADSKPADSEPANPPPESSESKPPESESTDSPPVDSKPETTKPDAVSPPATGPDADAKPSDTNEPEPEQPEPRPSLPSVLFEERDVIVQWHRRGFGSDASGPACARRLELDPQRERSCTDAPPTKRRRAGRQACSWCNSEATIEVLAPARPLELGLPRGLAALVPIALWKSSTSQPREAAPAFDRDRALEYTADDRATRLLAVIQAWSVLRWFSPHPPHDPQAVLREALCLAAEHEGPEAARRALDHLLGRFEDPSAGARPVVAHRRDARRWTLPVGIAWVAERIVAYPIPGLEAELDPLQPGDVIVEIDGQPIDTLLADRLPLTAAATASARVARAVDQLFERTSKRASIRLGVLREDASGEHRVTLELRASLPSDEHPGGGDRRPREMIFAIAGDTWYVDATRMPNLRLAARWLRKAKAVIVDLRGSMLDRERSLAAHWLGEPLEIVEERIRVGPTIEGKLPLEPFAHVELPPAAPRLHQKIIALADHRTRGRAELELAAFERVGATILGSTSAGELAHTATVWLPGGWCMSFGQTDALRHDGTPASRRGIAPSLALEPTWPAAREHDELLERAIELLEG